MRTIKVTLVTPIPSNDPTPLAALLGGDSGLKVEFTTEAMINDDDEAKEAGRQARQVMDDFVEGFAEKDDS